MPPLRGHQLSAGGVQRSPRGAASTGTHGRGGLGARGPARCPGEEFADLHGPCWGASRGVGCALPLARKERTRPHMHIPTPLCSRLLPDPFSTPHIQATPTSAAGTRALTCCSRQRGWKDSRTQRHRPGDRAEPVLAPQVRRRPLSPCSFTMPVAPAAPTSTRQSPWGSAVLSPRCVAQRRGQGDAPWGCPARKVGAWTRG